MHTTHDHPAVQTTDPAAALATLLALDLGTTTGWAASSQGTIHSGTISFRSGRYEGGGIRYLRFQAWLGEMLAAQRPDAVVFEEVRRHAGTDAAHVYGCLLATLTAWCEREGIAYLGVPVGTLKRHTTGRGNAPKAAMIAAMEARGHQPADDNEADALALLHWAIDTHAGAR